MTTPESGPSYYDVLDVDGSATTEEIRTAWREAIADLTPADRRFRLYNQAAEVLLDPERRAAYDAGHAAPRDGGDRGAEAPGAEPDRRRAPAAALPSLIVEKVRRTRKQRPGRQPRETTGRDVAGWLLVGVGILAVASVVLMSYLFTQPSEASVEDAAAEARSAAERAIVPILSYDHQTLDQDQQAAHAYLTEDYREEYDRFFEGVVVTNAERTRAVVDVEVVSSGVVRAAEERAEILLFVNRPTTNKATDKPVVYKDQVRVRLEKVSDEWLVDCMITTPEGSCGG